jgi:hypothetical protein
MRVFLLREEDELEKTLSSLREALRIGYMILNADRVIASVFARAWTAHRDQ